MMPDRRLNKFLSHITNFKYFSRQSNQLTLKFDTMLDKCQFEVGEISLLGRKSIAENLLLDMHESKKNYQSDSEDGKKDQVQTEESEVNSNISDVVSEHGDQVKDTRLNAYKISKFKHK
jgi:hypothetical protein